MKRMYVALSLWVMGGLLLGCASPSAQRQLELAPPQGEFSEALAAGSRLPRIRSAPSTPKQAPPPAQTPKAPDKPPAPPPQSQHKPASSSPAFTRWLDPKVARERFEQSMAEARRAYPHLYGKPGHEHHAHPIYLGGPKDGPTVQLDPAYHQLITNAFREAYAYGQGIPKPKDLERIMRSVYTRYPLPGVHF